MERDTATYRIGDELGRGALGRVVLVHDDASGETFAGKILHASHHADARAVARFEAEGALLAGLVHENLARVYGLVEVEGERMLLMELVRGPSLAEIVAVKGKLAPERVVAIGQGIAAGLAAAHRAGVIHRDLKPANVILAANDVPKIVDFGMARATSFAGIDDNAIAIAGTPDYMAPETIDPLAVDVRTDLYSLGCMLYEMVTGRPPFSGATSFAVIEAHRDAPVPELDDDTPAKLAQVIRWLLAKSPADRPQSAQAVRRALAEVLLDTGATPIRVAATQSNALVLWRGGGLAPRVSGQCAQCGATLVPEVAACFGCGNPQVRLEPGKFTVFVVGPGRTTYKLASERRQRLLDWLRANPSLGLDAAALENIRPRLPFVVVSRVSEDSAVALARALEALGLELAIRRGGRFSLPAMRRKAWTLSGRIAAMAVGGSYIAFKSALVFPILLLSVPVVACVGGFYMAGRKIITHQATQRPALPDGLSAALGRASDVVPGIGAGRHRDSLRGVIERGLALRAVVEQARAGTGHGPGQTPTRRRLRKLRKPWNGRKDAAAATAATAATGPGELDELDELDRELAHLIDLATVASSRVDELERALGDSDLRHPEPGMREALRERDAWAARLLDVTAFLDSLRARYAALENTTTGPAMEPRSADQTLEELRAHIEALEEIARL